MLSYLILTFSFGAGVAAFFSPCSLSLLPGYFSFYLSQKGADTSIKKAVFAGLLFALTSILGFFTVFGIAGTLVILFGQLVKQFVPAISIITGVLLIALGTYMLFVKDLFLSLPLLFEKRTGAYFFGVSFAIAALGCTFPLFATVLLQSISTTLFAGFVNLFVYILGMSLLMIGFVVLAAVSKNALKKIMQNIFPYIHKVSAVLIIIAGVYMIYYQTFLLL